jgi:uncharacterized membrane protein
MLLGAIGIAMAALGLNLIIQSRLLLDNDEKLMILSKQLKKLSFFIAIPIGVALSVFGILMPAFMESFISVGVTLIILSITMLIQSQALENMGDKKISVGRKIRVWAYICTGIGFIIVIILLVRTILV